MSDERTPACGIKGHTVGGYDGEKHWCVECTEAVDKSNARIPTTDEMILALVATGKFTLPDLLMFDDEPKAWRLNTPGGAWVIPFRPAHDLCAMHFAREAGGMDVWHIRAMDVFSDRMAVGNSPAAIQALWEATQ